VTRTYELGDSTVRALGGVSVRIEVGDYLAVVGPSGSGKSTLMHLLGALDRPTSGTLRVGGRDVAELGRDELARVRNETIGFVFQSFQLLPRTSAVDNVAMPLVYRGVRRSERRRRAEAALRAVGMGHRLGHTPNQLSGGEQQRVAIARALVGDPQVILADEPTGNLDSVRGAEVMDLLEALNRDRGVALVVVTHDLDIAARAHRQLRMRDGLADLWIRDQSSEEGTEERSVSAGEGSQPVRGATGAGGPELAPDDLSEERTVSAGEGSQPVRRATRADRPALAPDGLSEERTQ
jgi:putative ABC transport system ATP-binding protein